MKALVFAKMLIGREVESAKLAAALSSARGGSGSTLLLVGEPGIGKTTLLRELVAAAGGLQVLETAGVESEAELPYSALVDVLTPLLHHLDALPEVQALALSSALALGPPGAADRFAVAVATLGLLSNAAEQGPALVVVDDLQWVDSASRDALSFAARRLSAIPVVLVAAQRDGAARIPGADVVPVGPLGREDSAMVLSGATEGVAPQVVARLLDAARGNPLALVELPRLLTRGQRDGTEALGDLIPTANGLERAFAAQLRPLSAEGRRAGVVAAADNSGTAGVVIAALAALGLDAEALHEVETLGLLTIEANRLEFRHPLVRSAAYHGTDPAELRLVHGALGSVDGDPDRRAWHLAAAGVGPDEMVAAELERAGERALARAAKGAAAAALERAAALTPDREDRSRRLLDAADALDDAGGRERSEALALEAEALTGDPLLAGRAVAVRANLKISAGEVEAGHAMLLDEADRIAGSDPALAAGLLSLAATLPIWRLQAPAIVALTERARTLGDLQRPRTLVERVVFMLGKTISGDAEGMSLVLELAREVSASLAGHTQGAAIGWPLVWGEEYGTARSFLTWTIGVEREGGSRSLLSSSSALDGGCLLSPQRMRRFFCSTRRFSRRGEVGLARPPRGSRPRLAASRSAGSMHGRPLQPTASRVSCSRPPTRPPRSGCSSSVAATPRRRSRPSRRSSGSSARARSASPGSSSGHRI